MTTRQTEFDLAVVGAGIVGLACALAAARRGLKVVVIERSGHAVGASIRNFGFVTVTGQDPDATWQRAQRSRDVWLEIAAQAGIAIEQRGLWLPVRLPESLAVLEAYLRSEFAAGCELLTPAGARRRCAAFPAANYLAVLTSPHELRVESRDAIPKIAAWLARNYSVQFRWGTAVQAVNPPRIDTSRGTVTTDAAIVCPGDDIVTLFPERLAAIGTSRCMLQMLRLENPGFTLPGTVMSDLSLLRYAGFSRLPEADALRERLRSEQSDYLREGIHLIVAQGSDGTLVVGDSHRYDQADEPFASEPVYRLILDEYAAVMGHPAPAIRELWTGTYAVADNRVIFVDAPAPKVRLVVVTSGIGASTGFAIGEEVIAELCG